MRLGLCVAALLCLYSIASRQMPRRALANAPEPVAHMPPEICARRWLPLRLLLREEHRAPIFPAGLRGAMLDKDFGSMHYPALAP